MTPSSTQPADEWRPRERLAALFFTAFVLVQIAVPLFQLTQPRPTRFGWQMYATFPSGGVYLVEDATGGLDTVRVGEHSARSRQEVNVHPFLPRYLCEVDSGAVAIVFEPRGSDPQRHPCR